MLLWKRGSISFTNIVFWHLVTLSDLKLYSKWTDCYSLTKKTLVVDNVKTGFHFPISVKMEHRCIRNVQYIVLWRSSVKGIINLPRGCTLFPMFVDWLHPGGGGSKPGLSTPRQNGSGRRRNVELSTRQKDTPGKANSLCFYGVHVSILVTPTFWRGASLPPQSAKRIQLALSRLFSFTVREAAETTARARTRQRKR